MLLNIALFDSLLLAFIAIVRATPTIFHRDVPAYVGGIVVDPKEPVLSVTASITIPTTLTGYQGYKVSFSVALDGFNTSCSESSFQVGVFGVVNETGQASYSAAYHDPSLGDGAWNFMPPDIFPGDDIAMVVFINPHDMSSGYGTISNLSKNTVYSVNLISCGSSLPLCSTTGGWFVQTLELGGNTDLGVIEFLNANVSTVTGTYYPSNSSVIKNYSIKDQNGKVLYRFKPDGADITVQHPSG